MRTIRIYQVGNYGVPDIIDLSESAGQHVGTVLRMQAGEKLVLFSGDNREWDVEIVTARKKKVSVRIVAERLVNRESPRIIRLAQAISKGERMEIIIQKAVELGVTTITPLISEHCVVRLENDRLEKKHRQWEAIAISACEQCGRNSIPEIYAPITFKDFLKTCKISEKFLLHPTSNLTLDKLKLSSSEVLVLIGPEGGLSEEEIRLAIKNNFQAISLGPRILRTETAAISILSILQVLKGDLGLS